MSTRRSGPSIHGLRTESLQSPLGIDRPDPGLSWTWASDDRNAVQVGYRLLVSDAGPDAASLTWDSGWRASPASVLVRYAGPALRSRTRYHWTVEGRLDGRDETIRAPWSWFETALLEPDDWSARWIASRTAGSIEGPSPAPRFRRRFHLAAAPVRARLYLSGLGYVVAHVNGLRAGDRQLFPTPTEVDQRVLYQCLDVTDLLVAGDNVLIAEVGRAFTAALVETAWEWTKAPWRDRCKLLAQLEVTLDDGSTQVIATGPDWLVTDGPTRSDSVYAGETWDAARAVTLAQDAGWEGAEPAELAAPPRGALGADATQPVRVLRDIDPVGELLLPDGSRCVDFGRTLAGWTRVVIDAPEGGRTTLTYSQQRLRDGRPDLRQGYVHGGRFQLDEIDVAPGGEVTWEPSFSTRSFRYADITAPVGARVAVTARHVASDLAPVGTFACDIDLLTRIHGIVVPSVVNHLQGYPVVEPMYEKIGWLADAGLLAPTLLFNVDATALLRQWLGTIADSQAPDGQIPVIVPSGTWGYRTHSPEITSGFAVILWRVYLHGGDVGVLEAGAEPLDRYLAHELGRRDADGLVGTQLGDWLSPGYAKPPEDRRLSATAYLVHSLDLAASIAAVLGNAERMDRYHGQAATLRDAINRAFLDRDRARYVTATDPDYRQASNAIPVAFDIAPPDLVPDIVAGIVADIDRRRGHLNTGCFATSVLLRVLSRHGRHATALRVATQETYPSWGWWLRHGADTVWEGWELNSPSQGRPPARDHFLFGTIDQWLYEEVAGIRPTDAGFRRFRVDPLLDEGPSQAAATLDTPRGAAGSSWYRTREGAWRLEVTVPVGSTATVRLGGDPARLREGDVALTTRSDVAVVARHTTGMEVEVGHGPWTFSGPSP